MSGIGAIIFVSVIHSVPNRNAFNWCIFELFYFYSSFVVLYELMRLEWFNLWMWWFLQNLGPFVGGWEGGGVQSALITLFSYFFKVLHLQLTAFNERAHKESNIWSKLSDQSGPHIFFIPKTETGERGGGYERPHEK